MRVCPQGHRRSVDRGTCRLAIEPRNQKNRGADAVVLCGRQHHQSRYCELLVDPARSETPCMYGIFLRENRESPWLSVVNEKTTDRTGKAKAVIL